MNGKFAISSLAAFGIWTAFCPSPGNASGAIVKSPLLPANNQYRGSILNLKSIPHQNATATSYRTQNIFTPVTTGATATISNTIDFGKIKAEMDKLKASAVRVDQNFVYYLIDPPNAMHSEARAINANGDIVGIYTPIGSSGVKGFILHDGQYATVTIPQAGDLYLLGMNDAGTIVGAFTSGGKYHGIVIENGKYAIRDDAKSANTVLTGISNKGDIVGYTFGSDTDLKDIKLRNDDSPLAVVGTGSIICDVNNSDTMVGFVDKLPDIAPAQTTGIIVSGPQTQDIGIGHVSKAYGLNDAGDVVGTYSDPHGFLYHNGTYLSFDVPGSNGEIGTQAFGINNNGIVVGMFQDYSSSLTQGEVHGFVGVPR